MSDNVKRKLNNVVTRQETKIHKRSNAQKVQLVSSKKADVYPKIRVREQKVDSAKTVRCILKESHGLHQECCASQWQSLWFKDLRKEFH